MGIIGTYNNIPYVSILSMVGIVVIIIIVTVISKSESDL